MNPFVLVESWQEDNIVCLHGSWHLATFSHSADTLLQFFQKYSRASGKLSCNVSFLSIYFDLASTDDSVANVVCGTGISLYQ